MGCDIHMKVQARGTDGVWHEIDVERPCYCTKRDTPGKWVRKDDGKEFPCFSCEGKLTLGVYDERNYSAFAILAGVRNGSHGEHFIPISEPKGLPDDLRGAAAEARDALMFDWEGDDYRVDYGDHSFSWLTLRELLEYPHWDAIIGRQGWIGLEEFQRWDAAGGGEPKGGYSGGVGGGGVVHVSNDTMRDLIAGGPDVQREYGRQRTAYGATPGYYTEVHWIDTYKEEAGNLYSSFIPALTDLGPGPDDVRIVFGFDS